MQKKLPPVILRNVSRDWNNELRQEAIIMKKYFKEHLAILMFSTGLFGASLIVGLIFFYELDKIF